MPIVTPAVGADFSFAEFVDFFDDLIFDSTITLATRTSTFFEATWIDPINGLMRADVTGVGFLYDVTGDLVGGTIDAITGYDDGVLQGTITNINLSAAELDTALTAESNGNPFAVEELLLSANWTYNGTSANDIALPGSTIGDDGYLFNPAGNDTFNLGGGANNFFAGDGNDIVSGGSGVDILYGGNGNDYLEGNGGNDQLFGGAGADQFEGGAGDDLIDGGSNVDDVDDVNYRFSPGAVYVDLANNTASDGFGGTDTLISIEGAWDSDFNDTILGDANDNWVRLSDGVDFADGAGGQNDVLFVDNSPSGVSVDLTTGIVLDGFGNTDMAINFENVHVGMHNDTVTLSDGVNSYVFGGAGNDILNGGTGNNAFFGGSGNDTIDGGAGIDAANYLDDGFDQAGLAFQGVTVNLQTGTAIDGWNNTDTLISIESVIGSSMDDIITSNGAVGSYIGGMGGNDTLIGASTGIDNLDGGDGDDNINPGETDNYDNLIGSRGNDTIVYTNSVNGYQQLSYFALDQGITVTLDGVANTGSVNKGANGTDMLTDFATAVNLAGNGGFGISGTGFDDTFNINNTAADQWMQMAGGAGVDTYNITSGQVRIDFRDFSAIAGLNVNLATGVVGNDGHGNSETINGNAWEIRGTDLADSITGSVNDESFIGRQGNDVIDGGGGFDRLRFDRGGVGDVTVDLGAGTATGMWSGNAFSYTISNIEWIVGSKTGNDMLVGADATNDTLEGKGGNDTLRGNGGNDILDGGADSDTAVYANALNTYALSLNNTDIMITGTGEGTDTVRDNVEFFQFSDGTVSRANLLNIINPPAPNTINITQSIAGRFYNDILEPGLAFATVSNLTSTEIQLVSSIDPNFLTIMDGVGFNSNGGSVVTAGTINTITVFYNGVQIAQITNMSQSAVDLYNAQDAANTTNDLAIFNALFDANPINYDASAVTTGGNVSFEGTSNNDTMTGVGGTTSSADSFYQGLGGSDSYIGGSGYDQVVYKFEGGAFGITANFVTGIGSDSFGNAEAYSGTFEGIWGTNFVDMIVGGSNSISIRAFGGNDILDGTAGSRDEVRYDKDEVNGGIAGAGIVVDLDDGTGTGGNIQGNATDGFGDTDTLINIERVRGTNNNDQITGSSLDNRLRGNGGDDTLNGEGGNDNLQGGSGNDTINGGDGDDFIAGGAGADIIDGGNSNDFINHADDASQGGGGGIIANRTAGTVLDGFGDTDIISNIENVRGTNQADVILGNFNFVQGLGGDDLFDGQGNGGMVSYFEDANYGGGAGVTVNLATQSAIDGFGDTDTIISYNDIEGSQSSDNLTGDGDYNFIRGLAGNDVIDGGGSNDMLSYDQDVFRGAVAGALVNLSTNSATDGFGGIDTITNIQDVRGSSLSDTIIGNANNNFIQGLGGADTLDGGGGTGDMVAYDQDQNYGGNAGVIVNLVTGTATDGFGDTDTLSNFENVRGTNFSDIITGDANNNFIQGLGGADTLDGGGGTGDMVAYDQDQNYGGNAGVNVNLVTGTATDGFGDTDTLSNFENVKGTSFADNITGDSNSNYLETRDGNDTINAGGGNDSIRAGSGDDIIDGGDGWDWIRPGTGNDTITGGGSTGNGLSYEDISSGVTVNKIAGTATATGKADTFTNVEHIRGTNFADILTGGNAANNGYEGFEGLAGNDIIDGGSGYDEVQYHWEFAYGGTSGITLNLTTGSVVDGFGDIDAISGIESVRATRYADSLTGSSANYENFRGLAGDDLIDGGMGSDQTDYSRDESYANTLGQFGTGGVTVNLAAGTATDGYGDSDTLLSVEGVRGTNAVDNLTGGGNDYYEYFRGLGGNDIIDGGSGFDSVSYSSDAWKGGTSGVTVNLATGIAVDGFGDTDTLISIEAARGTEFADVLTGGNAASDDQERFSGYAGNDVIDGGSGFDVASYGGEHYFDGSTTGIIATLTGGGAGTVTDTFGDTDTLIGIESIAGSVFVDTITGSSDDEKFVGFAGADFINGGGGIDLVSYLFDELSDSGNNTNQFGTAGVTVNLTTQSATDGYGDTDVLMNIENVGGTRKADVLTGDSNDNIFFGYAGNDTINGGGGNDTVSYEQDGDSAMAGLVHSSIAPIVGGVTVDLQTQTATDSFGDTDTLTSIENVEGGNLDDTIIASLAANAINGGGGIDTLSYAGSNAGVDVNLFLGTGFGGHAQGDTHSNIENLVGTAFFDILKGDSGANSIQGGAGNDSLNGGGGSDTLSGGADNDTLIGNADVNAQVSDTLDGGAGDDVFYAEYTDTIIGGTGRDILYQVNDYAMTIDLGATSIEWMRGGFNGDTINGATQSVGIEVYSGGGDDIVTGSGFSDFLFVGAGNDTVNGGGGNDVIFGDIGADSLSGGAGNDSIFIDSSDTFFFGGADYDALYIEDSAGLTVDMAATSFEWLRGSTVGGDNVDASNQTQGVNVFASGGNDTVIGSNFGDFLWGEAGDDILTGNGGNDVLVGGGGSDRMNGGAGFDVIYANAGGGADGAIDTFIMGSNWGTDILFDFEDGTDIIDMSALGIAFGDLTITASGAHAHISYAGNLISVADSAGLIDAGDFLF